MKQILFVITFILFISLLSFGQSQEKVYYNSEWKICKKDSAKYYRVYGAYDNSSNSWPIKSFYINGTIQFIGNVQNNSHDATNCKTAKCDGQSIFYNEKGLKTTIKNYKSGILNGPTSYFYENGKLRMLIDFENGELKDKFFVECDEFEKCQKVFHESFASEENINDWQLVKNEKDYKSSIIAEKGLLMETKTENGFRQTINIPLSLSEDFSIETIIDFKSGEKNSGQGLLWGFKDWDNYYYFHISGNGYYKIGAKTKGIDLEFIKWTQTNTLNQDYERNLIKVLRVKDKMYFSINGSLVHSEDFYTFRGNNIGFQILSGKKSVLFEKLIVKQDIENNLVSDNVPNSNFGDWKGNGTGFFISKDGYLATNYHVVAEATEIEIEFIRNGQKQNYKAKVIQSDKQNDLAVLKIDDKSFVPFSSIPYNFQTSLTDVGSNVFALGSPMALSVMGTEIKFTDGKISSKTGFQGDIATYQMTTPIQSGNSGGPLFDFDGNLIGINSAKIRADVADNVSYAIKSSYLKNLIDVLPTTLSLPNDKAIMNKILTEKIKIISDYVVLIRIK
jgi:S1-C subfamily serine protease